MTARSWTFGEMEATLSVIHSIADSKRTAFQARIKNFNRLGLPNGLEMRKGKATQYGAGEIVEMALALEMTQLGLTPDRIAWIIPANWFAISMAVRMAARALEAQPSGFADEKVTPLSMFLFFDPSAMRPLTGPAPLRHEDGSVTQYHPDEASNTFFYGGEGIVRENIVNWTSGNVPRLSLINVTAMLDVLSYVLWPFDELEAPSEAQRREFFAEVAEWGEGIEEGYFRGEGLAPKFYLSIMFHQDLLPRDFDPLLLDDLTERYSDATGIPERLVRIGLEGFRANIRPEDWNWESSNVDPQA